jgi:hypothetical protein
MDLPQDNDSMEFPAADGSFDMVFQDGQLDTLRVTIDLADGSVTSAFIAVGVPGTSIDDETYFADFFRSQCQVSLTRLDETAAQGAFRCDGLENASSDNPKSVNLQGEFYAIPTATASPGASGSPAPSASAAN